MSQKHKTKIQKIFEHPLSGNIDIKRLLSALEHYGATVDVSNHGKAHVVMNNKEHVLPLLHGDTLSKDEIVKLRHFLESVNLTPDSL